MRCHKKLESGRKCKNHVTSGSKYCWFHSKHALRRAYNPGQSLLYFALNCSEHQSTLLAVDLKDAFTTAPNLLSEDDIDDFLKSIREFTRHNSFVAVMSNRDTIIDFQLSPHGDIQPIGTGNPRDVKSARRVQFRVTGGNVGDVIHIDLNVVETIPLDKELLLNIWSTAPRPEPTPTPPKVIDVTHTHAVYSVKGEDTWDIQTTKKGEITAIVCDGHGGDATALFVKDTLPQLIRSSPNITMNSISNAFLKCDNMIRERFNATPHLYNTGTTVSIVVQVGDIFYIATCGDSGVVLVDGYDNIIPLLQKPRDAEQLRAPLTASVNMKSSLGDFHLKDRNIYNTWCAARKIKCQPWKEDQPSTYVSAIPTVYGVKHSDSFTLVVATDGLYDVVSEHEITKATQKSGVKLTADDLLQSAFRATGGPVTLKNKQYRLRDDATILVLQVKIT